MKAQPAIDPLLEEQPGHTDCLLGNEAIVRGALEAGLSFACGYPGTPSSEITDSFARVAPKIGLEFEYSVNEKICIEMTFAASLAGGRAICAMKHLGLMYGGDPLSTIPYIGAVGGLVIVSAADPSCNTSPNEQDQRHLATMLGIPMLEPSTPQEALEQTRFAFELSEQCELPVILRPTTRVCHTRSVVRFGERIQPKHAQFQRDPRRFNPLPVNARRLRLEMKTRLAKAAELIGRAGLIRREGAGSRGILSSGAPAATCADLLAEAGVENQVVLLTLGAAYPLPEAELLQALSGVERLLVLEELSPFLEDMVTALCARKGRPIEILGKRSGHTPEEFEYGPEVIGRAVHAAFQLGPAPAPAQEARALPEVPPRSPSLCPGCPHRSSFYAARSAFDEEQLYFNDIGCYTLGGAPPLGASDALLSMGAGFTLAAGVARVTGQKTVGFMGDSTFFHSGMPALLNAIKEKVNMVAVILDNEVTAMTGFQESPTVSVESGRPVRKASIEAVVRALGAAHVERVDPEDLAGAVLAYRRAYEADGVGVVISERPCPIFMTRVSGGPRTSQVFEVDPSTCRHCGREALGTRCGQQATVPFSRQMAGSRILECGSFEHGRPEVAACAEQCPLQLCVQGYAAHIASGHYAEALELIMERLPLPDTVCRVCERPCESVCVRGRQEGPVAINDLKRFVLDWANTQAEFPYRPTLEAEHGHRVAVVGAGPAGLAAAHELRLRGYAVSLFDAEARPGGLLRSGIPAYRLPEEALERDLARILGLGVEFVGGVRLGRDLEIADLLNDGFDAVCLCVGAAQSRTLPLDAVTGGPEVLQALAYLKQARSGGPSASTRKVVVIGGGNSAVDAARTALRQGAEQVVIACLESRLELPAISEEIEAAQREGVELRTRTQVRRLVEAGVELVPVELLGDSFRLDRIRALEQDGEELRADLVILAVGQEPDRSIRFDSATELEWTEAGLLATDRQTCATSHPRVFAGGDLVCDQRTVTDAIAAGQRAVFGIDSVLRGQAAAGRRQPPPIPKPRPNGSQVPGRHDRVERYQPPTLSADLSRQSFDEVVGVLTEQAARKEAERCMICGQCGNCSACIETFGCPAFYLRDGLIKIDEALCVGCGVCVSLCPNGAISMREGAEVQA